MGITVDDDKTNIIREQSSSRSAGYRRKGVSEWETHSRLNCVYEQWELEVIITKTAYMCAKGQQ